MPELRITVSPALLKELQKRTADYNANNGVTLTVTDWLVANLKREMTQIALGEFINKRREELETGGNQQLNNEAQTEQQRLMDELG